MSVTYVDAGYSEVKASPGSVSLTAHDDTYCGCDWSDKAEFDAFIAGMIEAGRIAFGGRGKFVVDAVVTDYAEEYDNGGDVDNVAPAGRMTSSEFDTRKGAEDFAGLIGYLVDDHALGSVDCTVREV